MILRNSDLITIEAHDEKEIRRLKNRGFVNIFEEKRPLRRKKKSTSTTGTKGKRST